MFAVGSFSQEPFGASEGGLIKGSPASLSSNFTQTSAANRITVGSMPVSGIASIASAACGILFATVGTLSSNITQSAAGLRVRTAGTGVLDVIVSQATTAVYLAQPSLDLVTSVVQSTNGELKFEEIDAGATAETWTEITHTGDTWTEINAGTTAETWTEVLN